VKPSSYNETKYLPWRLMTSPVAAFLVWWFVLPRLNLRFVGAQSSADAAASARPLLLAHDNDGCSSSCSTLQQVRGDRFKETKCGMSEIQEDRVNEGKAESLRFSVKKLFGEAMMGCSQIVLFR
jgi:hypothetical protein